MSTTVRSVPGSPSTIQSASALPAPPAEAMPTELKPAATKKFRSSGASPRMNWLSGVKLSGPLYSFFMPVVASDRDPVDRAVHQDREVIPVLAEQLELERVRQLVGRDPGLGLRLEAADQQAADLFLDVGVAVRVAQHGQVPVHAGDLVGHHVEVLGRVQRHGDPAHRADLPWPTGPRS